MATKQDTTRGLHNRYRPRTLADVKGYQTIKASLRGFLEDPSKLPSAILFTGSTGTGKTTLARAFASDLLGVDCTSSGNYFELNIGTSKTIEDIREVANVSKLRPIGASHRIILLDEVHQILSNPQAANALLKPLEEPVSTTLFLLASMEGAKFQSSQLGRALRGRCNVFPLPVLSPKALTAQALEIFTGEGHADVDADVVAAVVENCDSSMRELSMIIEQVLATGKPLTTKLVQSVVSSTSPQGEQVVEFLLALYNRSFEHATLALLSVTDGYDFLARVSRASMYILNHIALQGERHPSNWATPEASAVMKTLKKKPSLDLCGEINSELIGLRIQAGAFAVPEAMALSATAYRICCKG